MTGDLKVDWHAADALDPAAYAHLMTGVGGVVHTLGTLIEDGGRYKAAVRSGDFGALAASLLCTAVGGAQSVLEPRKNSYEVMNRDTGAFFLDVLVLLLHPPG